MRLVISTQVLFLTPENPLFKLRNYAMDLDEIHKLSGRMGDQITETFLSLPGSSILLRYIKSSYQNDPVRSVIELLLFLFAIRYVFAPAYSTQKTNFAKLSDEV